MQYKSINLYKEKRHQTDDKKQILILLYEKVVLLLDESIEKISDYKNYSDVNNNLKKIIEIVEELKNSIDMKQGEISEKLYQLYTYIIEETTKANIEKKKDKLVEIKKIIDDLLGAWRKASSTIEGTLALNKNLNTDISSKPSLENNNSKGLEISI